MNGVRNTSAPPQVKEAISKDIFHVSCPPPAGSSHAPSVDAEVDQKKEEDEQAREKPIAEAYPTS